MPVENFRPKEVNTTNTGNKVPMVNYNLKNIRILVNRTYVEFKELKQFCSDNDFIKVLDNIGSGQTKDEVIQSLLNHCRQYKEMDRLLYILEQESPFYKEHFPYIN